MFHMTWAPVQYMMSDMDLTPNLQTFFEITILTLCVFFRLVGLFQNAGCETARVNPHGPKNFICTNEMWKKWSRTYTTYPECGRVIPQGDQKSLNTTRWLCFHLFPFFNVFAHGYKYTGTLVCERTGSAQALAQTVVRLGVHSTNRKTPASSKYEYIYIPGFPSVFHLVRLSVWFWIHFLKLDTKPGWSHHTSPRMSARKTDQLTFIFRFPLHAPKKKRVAAARARNGILNHPYMLQIGCIKDNRYIRTHHRCIQIHACRHKVH